MTETSKTLLNLLRNAKFGWIADELVESLALGKQVVKDFKEGDSGRKSRGTSVVPYTDEEELRIIVETLAQYFIILPQAWAEARALFSSSETFSKVLPAKRRYHPPGLLDKTLDDAAAVELGIANEAGEPFTHFSRDYLTNAAPALWKTLAQLWPSGHEDFLERYPLPEVQA
jgi:hypothetical protein